MRAIFEACKKVTTSPSICTRHGAVWRHGDPATAADFRVGDDRAAVSAFPDPSDREGDGQEGLKFSAEAPSSGGPVRAKNKDLRGDAVCLSMDPAKGGREAELPSSRPSRRGQPQGDQGAAEGTGKAPEALLGQTAIRTRSEGNGRAKTSRAPLLALGPPSSQPSPSGGT